MAYSQADIARLRREQGIPEDPRELAEYARARGLNVQGTVSYAGFIREPIYRELVLRNLEAQGVNTGSTPEERYAAEQREIGQTFIKRAQGNLAVAKEQKASYDEQRHIESERVLASERDAIAQGAVRRDVTEKDGYYELNYFGVEQPTRIGVSFDYSSSGFVNPFFDMKQQQGPTRMDINREVPSQTTFSRKPMGKEAERIKFEQIDANRKAIMEEYESQSPQEKQLRQFEDYLGSVERVAGKQADDYGLGGFVAMQAVQGGVGVVKGFFGVPRFAKEIVVGNGVNAFAESIVDFPEQAYTSITTGRGTELVGTLIGSDLALRAMGPTAGKSLGKVARETPKNVKTVFEISQRGVNEVGLDVFGGRPIFRIENFELLPKEYQKVLGKIPQKEGIPSTTDFIPIRENTQIFGYDDAGSVFNEPNLVPVKVESSLNFEKAVKTNREISLNSKGNIEIGFEGSNPESQFLEKFISQERGRLAGHFEEPNLNRFLTFEDNPYYKTQSEYYLKKTPRTPKIEYVNDSKLQGRGYSNEILKFEKVLDEFYDPFMEEIIRKTKNKSSLPKFSGKPYIVDINPSVLRREGLLLGEEFSQYSDFAKKSGLTPDKPKQLIGLGTDGILELRNQKGIDKLFSINDIPEYIYGKSGEKIPFKSVIERRIESSRNTGIGQKLPNKTVDTGVIGTFYNSLELESSIPNFDKNPVKNVAGKGFKVRGQDLYKLDIGLEEEYLKSGSQINLDQIQPRTSSRTKAPRTKGLIREVYEKLDDYMSNRGSFGVGLGGIAESGNRMRALESVQIQKYAETGLIQEFYKQYPPQPKFKEPIQERISRYAQSSVFKPRIRAYDFYGILISKRKEKEDEEEFLNYRTRTTQRTETEYDKDYRYAYRTASKSDTKQDKDYKFLFDSATRVTGKQRTRTREDTDLLRPPFYPTRTPKKPIEDEPGAPFLPLIDDVFDSFSPKRRFRKVSRRKYGYAPSLTAEFFGIKSSKIPNYAGGFTGAEIRPIIEQRRRRRK